MHLLALILVVAVSLDNGVAQEISVTECPGECVPFDHPCPKGYVVWGECSMPGFKCCVRGTTPECEKRGGVCVPEDDCDDYYELAGPVGSGPLCDNGFDCCRLCNSAFVGGQCEPGPFCPPGTSPVNVPCPGGRICCKFFGK